MEWTDYDATWDQLTEAFMAFELRKESPDFKKFSRKLQNFSAEERHGAWIRIAQNFKDQGKKVQCYLEALHNDPDPSSVAWLWLDGSQDDTIRILSPNSPKTPEIIEALRQKYGTILKEEEIQPADENIPTPHVEEIGSIDVVDERKKVIEGACMKCGKVIIGTDRDFHYGFESLDIAVSIGSQCRDCGIVFCPDHIPPFASSRCPECGGDLVSLCEGKEHIDASMVEKAIQMGEYGRHIHPPDDSNRQIAKKDRITEDSDYGDKGNNETELTKLELAKTKLTVSQDGIIKRSVNNNIIAKHSFQSIRNTVITKRMGASTFVSTIFSIVLGVLCLYIPIKTLSWICAILFWVFAIFCLLAVRKISIKIFTVDGEEIEYEVYDDEEDIEAFIFTLKNEFNIAVVDSRSK